MDVRLVAYRRETTGDDTFDVTQFELDLQEAPNVVVNYNWLDLKNPDTRTSSFSQTLKLPFSNANNTFFENYFDVNLESLVYDAKTKFSAILYIDSIPQLKGFIQLKSIYMNARLYEVALFGDTADFFTDLKDNRLKDAFRTQDTTNPQLYLLSKILDHKLTLANIVASWTTGLTTVLGATTNDIMYPIIDYGHTTNPYSSAMFWDPADVYSQGLTELGGNVNDAFNYYGMIQASNLKPAIRIQRLLHIIAAQTGYTIKSTFLGIDGDSLTNTNWFSRLFMTLSTEHSRVQTLFNTSGGSEAPFIGFQANMSSSSGATTFPVTDPSGIGIIESVFSNLDVDNEVFDPNNLYNNQLTDWGVGGITGVDTPSIKIPVDITDNTLLPTGTISVKVTLTININSTISPSGDPLSVVQLRPRWYNQTTNTPVGNGFQQSVFTGSNVTIETTQELQATPGTIYYFLLECIPYPVSAQTGTQDATATISACTIETEQTDNIGLMSGGLNGEVQMYHNMPDMTQADFVKDLVNRFNLIIQTDPNNEKELLIEPYQDYINAGTTKYWTDKLDISKEQVIKPTNELQSKVLKFGDLEDEDILNQRYKNIYNIVYGTYTEKRRNNFASSEFENFSVFSPFIAQGIGQWDGDTINGALANPNVALAYLFKAEQGEPGEPLETMKPKLFYYSGTPIDITGENTNTGNDFAFHIYSNQFLQTGDATTTNNKFPLCTQYNLDTLGSVTANTKLLNWTWYTPSFNTGFTFNYFGNTYSEHGFYNDYWSQYINEIYSDDARIMECYLNLDPVDIETFAGTGFQNVYFIKNTLWRIISVDNYLVGGNKSTKVTLLKVIEELTNDCGAIPTITNTGLMTWVDAGSGASTTITNSCCEEVNPNWTFVQTNSTTGVGNCYTEASGVGGFTFDNIDNQDLDDPIPVPSLMPNLQTNYNIITTNGNAYTTTFYIQGITLDSSTTTNFSYNGLQSQLFSLSILSMNYVKVNLLGSIVTGTNSSKCGYFEYDTILVNRDNTNSQVGSAGGTLLKTNKDGSFTTPTVNITTFDNRGFWTPTIVGGASERVNWVAKVTVIRQPLGDPDATLIPNVRAIYQNAENILFQDLDNLIWN
tara:strand:+ start:142 stop:3468 length:3327 start_codon:yes stop_codon:yes gene_type:complete